MINLLQGLWNRVLFRRTRANRYLSLMATNFDGKAADIFLTVLLRLMCLTFILSPKFRRNIKDFNATYVFVDKSTKLYVVAKFKNSKLKVQQKHVEEFDFKLVFKDGRALFKLLLSKAPDILDAVLKQEVDFSGNINYLNKFAYMAMHLRLMALGKL